MSSATASTESAGQSSPPAGPVPSKKKSNKKKKSANKRKPVTEVDKNGGGEGVNADYLSDEPETAGLHASEESDRPASPFLSESSTTNGHVAMNGHVTIPTPAAAATTAAATALNTAASSTMSAGESEVLRADVDQLRKQLQDVRETHRTEIARLRAELDESEAAKERAEAQYEALVERVEKIKTTLGDRLKSDKAELEAAKDRVEELEAENDELRRAARTINTELGRLRDETEMQGRELAALRSQSSLAQRNWLKEKEDLARQAQQLRSELESTSSAMGEWEVIAMEERSMRESLADKAADLEDQVVGLRDAYERAAADRDTQSQAVDGLQRALREIQEARKKELREMVATSEEQLQAMKARVREADARADQAEAARATLCKELERMAPFEREVKEKNLLIGKLRHEAIVLNDHLTKALKYIKKTKPEETIDRQIVTNHLLQFLALDRSDPKKFQILQVIAGLLNWTDEQREQAGLARPGTAGNSLRLPASPFQRTPSSPALGTEFFAESTSVSSKETLADLWAGFLERSVEEAGRVPLSRKDSMSSVTTATTRPDTRGGG